jgi:hypothetical protein
LRLAPVVPDTFGLDSDDSFEAYRKRGVIGKFNEHFGTIAAAFVDGAVANHLTGELFALDHFFLGLQHNNIAERDWRDISFQANFLKLLAVDRQRISHSSCVDS